MQSGEEPKVDDVLCEITTILAAAYQRRSQIHLIRAVPESLASTETLDNTAKASLHGMTLTRQRKESYRS